MNAGLTIRVGGRTVDLPPGGKFLSPRDKLYRDTPDQLIDAIRRDIARGCPWREAVTAHVAANNPWLHRIVTEPTRALWLQQHPLRSESLILDVGAGWGQWVLPAAAQNARVVALEPNPTRLGFIEDVVRQEGQSDRVYFVGMQLEDVEFPGLRFDQIHCIGVLEWVPQFNASSAPLVAQRQFLQRLRAALAPDGTCIIGIENRLGLKYLLGSPDDHTGLPGISVFEATLADKLFRARTGTPLSAYTHTAPEYTTLLQSAGFQDIEFFAAFPDYKVPQLIVPLANGAANKACQNGAPYPEHNGSNGSPIEFSDELSSHYRTFASMGIAGNFAPSFFIKARANPFAPDP